MEAVEGGEHDCGWGIDIFPRLLTLTVLLEDTAEAVCGFGDFRGWWSSKATLRDADDCRADIC